MADATKCQRCGRSYARHRGQFKIYANCPACARSRIVAIQKVHRAFNKALKEGLVRRCNCEVCGAIKADPHHDDYAKPLNVRWLCRSHHRLHHAKAGPGLNANA